LARLAFIQTEWFEHLGVLSLAASARADGHEVFLIMGRNPKRIVPRLLELRPQVAAFSATTGAHKKALHLAGELRPWFQGRIILGGPHPTFFPEVIEDPALDAICRGEADLALPEFLSRLEADDGWEATPGFIVKKNGQILDNGPAIPPADLDALPFPARDALYTADPWLGRVTMRRVMAGRGCPYRCTYCFNQAMQELVAGKGPYIRLRGVDNVMAELREIAARGARTVNFVDDTFGIKKSWAMELLDRYRSEVSLPFIVNLRPEQANKELVKALAKAGCYCVQLGVESASFELRKEALGREVTDEELEAAARRIKEAGIRLLTYNMVGLPGESLSDAAKTLEWNAKVGADFPRVSIFQPYPRTVLGDKVLAKMCGQETPSFESYFRRSPLSGREVRRIENLQKLFHPYIKFPALRPLLTALTRLPANPVFDIVFLASIGAQYRRATNRTVAETLRLGLRNLAAYKG